MSFETTYYCMVVDSAFIARGWRLFCDGLWLFLFGVRFFRVVARVRQKDLRRFMRMVKVEQFRAGRRIRISELAVLGHTAAGKLDEKRSF